MKKNIGFIPMDSVLEEWLLEKLMKEPPKSDCAEDLLFRHPGYAQRRGGLPAAERIRRGGKLPTRPAGRDADWRTGNQPQKQEGRHGGR